MKMTERTSRANCSRSELLWRWIFFFLLVATTFGLTLGQAFAATCSITTTPTPPTINAGQSVQFDGSVSGKSPRTYAWTFAGGTPATSSQQSVTVTYNSPGSFLATLNGTNSSKKNNTCTASVTVTVNAGGNQVPECRRR